MDAKFLFFFMLPTLFAKLMSDCACNDIILGKLWFKNNIQSMLAFKTYLTKAMDRLLIFYMQKQNMCVLHKFATHNNVLQLLKKQKKVIWLHQKFLNVRNSSTSVRAMHSVKATSTSTDKARMIYKTFIRGCESKLAKYNCE